MLGCCLNITWSSRTSYDVNSPLATVDSMKEATVRLQCTLLQLRAHRPVVHLVVLNFSMHAVKDGDVVAL